MNGDGGARVVLSVLSGFLWTAVVVVAVTVLVDSPGAAAGFAHMASTAIGHGVGLAIGSLPNLFDAVRKGIALCH